MLVERLEMVPVECVVRGYITGSGWKDYQATGAVCGIELPAGLEESEQLPEPIFTPATKAEVGDHDENVDFDRAAEIVGDRALLEELRRLSIAALPARAPSTRASAASSSPTPSSSSAADPTARSCSATRCSRPTRRASGRPTATSRAARSRRFDKQYVRDWARELRLGQVAAGAARSRTRWSRAPARATSRPTSGSPASRSSAWLERSGRVRARVLIRPKEGILDPQGQAVERALPALGFEGVSHVHVGRLVELDVEDPSQAARRCASGCSPTR